MKLSYNRIKGETCPQNEFIHKANKVHNYRFNYSKTIYINSSKKIIVICPLHGEFYPTPNAHLSGNNCPKCRNEKLRKERQINFIEFIDKCKNVHNNKFDYSKVNYINCDHKIEIICSNHGSFWQTPYTHLHHKYGCPKCTHRISKVERDFLDYMKIPEKDRQVNIKGKFVDGFIPYNNVVIEFLGDYWHGNPEVVKLEKVNQKAKKTFQELYNETINKFKFLNSFGYSIFYIWENDWKRYRKGIVKEPKIKLYVNK